MCYTQMVFVEIAAAINIVVREENWMSRHQNYSKRSRESRKAMSDGTADDDDVDDAYADCCERVAEDLSPVADDARSTTGSGELTPPPPPKVQ